MLGRMEWREGNVHESLKKVEERIREVLENRRRERKGNEEKRLVGYRM